MRVLTLMKANAARRGQTIELKWSRGVFKETSAPPVGIVGTIDRGVVRDLFLELLDKFAEAGRYVTDSQTASNYAPRAFARSPDSKKFKEGDFRRAMEELFAQKKIEMGTHKGPDRKEYRCIVRAPK